MNKSNLAVSDARKPEILDQMEQLSERGRYLTELTKELNERLDSVLRPNEPSNGEIGKASCSTVLGGKLQSIGEIQEMAIYNVSSILNRLEI